MPVCWKRCLVLKVISVVNYMFSFFMLCDEITHYTPHSFCQQWNNETKCFVVLAIVVRVFVRQGKFQINRYYFPLNTKRQQTLSIISLILNNVYHKESFFLKVYIFLNANRRIGHTKFKQDLTFSFSESRLLRHIHSENRYIAVPYFTNMRVFKNKKIISPSC